MKEITTLENKDLKEVTIDIIDTCKFLCAWCRGVDQYGDRFDPIPAIRINEAGYIPNFGEVKIGEWIHKNPSGQITHCEASGLKEYLFQRAEEFRLAGESRLKGALKLE